jgi:hypothetical protein
MKVPIPKDFRIKNWLYFPGLAGVASTIFLPLTLTGVSVVA